MFLLENLGFPALAVANPSMSVPIELECQYCRLLGLRPSVLGQDRSETIQFGFGLGLARCGLGLVHCGLGLAGVRLCCERKTILSRSIVVIMISNDTTFYSTVL